MLRYDLQFFGGRGASGTMKTPNGKVVGNGNADTVHDEYEQQMKREEDTTRALSKQYAEDHEENIYSEKKEKEIDNEIIKKLKESGMSTIRAEKTLNRIKNESRDENYGKAYWKENGEYIDVKVGGETNFGLVKKDGQKATIFLAVNGESGVSGITKLKPTEAYIYNVNGRDIAVHNIAKGLWTTTDVATGMSFGRHGETKQKALDFVKNSGAIDYAKNSLKSYSDRNIETWKKIQKKLRSANK